MSSVNDADVEWFSVPETEVHTIDGDSVRPFGSALLVVQVPQGIDDIEESTMTCTIDARWAPGHSVSDGVLRPVLDREHLREPLEQQPGQIYNYASGFLPKDDGMWQSISLDPEWLDTLTPIIEKNGENQTTLTVIFTAISLNNGTHHIPHRSDGTDLVYDTAANVIATLVTDGISRIGIHYQDRNPTILPCKIEPEDYQAFFSGDPLSPSHAYPPPYNVASANQTHMRWYITLSGLSYKADDTANILALTLLLVYVLMAFMYMGSVIITRSASDAWEDVAELLLLAKNSPPLPAMFADTCAGIEAKATWESLVKVRVVGTPVPGEEEPNMLIDENENGYEKVRTGTRHGEHR